MNMRQAAVKICIGILTLMGTGLPRPLPAHPMGNFSINHYARFEAHPNRLFLRYRLDFAEIPTVTELRTIDADHNNAISDTERNRYLNLRAAQLCAGLSLKVNDRPTILEIRAKGLESLPGAGGLSTLRLTLEMTAPLPVGEKGTDWEITYQDSNFAERTGWKEIIAVAAKGAALARSSVPAVDISRELTVYPADPSIAAPQTTEARFTVRSGAGATVTAESSQAPRTPPRSASSPPTTLSHPRTPQDAFTQTIAAKELTAGLILISLGLAFLFGAFHALSPGHGKGMVAAYLVGTRGTVRHAIFLGAVVTLTHTLGVFGLGIVTLTAAQFIVPERLYPALSAVSGSAIVMIGAAMLWQRLMALRAQNEADAIPSQDGDREYDDGAGPPLPENAPVSFRSLLILGITGGALPCPSALVVMLSAIALHRIAFGLALIGAFSLGLAAVLTGIGLLVVRVRRVVERLPFSGKFAARLPVLSAALVTSIGLALVFRAFSGSAP
jgi:nickel/cobalt exporter